MRKTASHLSRWLPALLVLLWLAGCATGRDVAPRRPWFQTEPDLEKKAARLEAATWNLVDRSGLLMYAAHEPLTDRQNYLRSHGLADAPAWQGYLMAAVAFEAAVTDADRDLDLRRLAEGLRTFHDVTGVKGLLGRSMIADYTGPRLDWMSTEEDRPTRFWMQGPTGAWWRNGLAKGHLTLACFGCAVPLILHRRGDLALRPETQKTLLAVLLPAVFNLVAADYRIRDWDGRFTEYGNLGPQTANGFNMLLVLSMLASAAPYDARLQREYEEKIRALGPMMGTSLTLLGKLVNSVGHHRIGKPSYSDMQTAALAGLALLLQEERREHVRHIHRALTGLWTFVRDERNAPFTLTYAALVRPADGERRLAEIVQDLRDFPVEKRPRKIERVDTSVIQPLANRPINTNYWKSSPYRRIGEDVGPETGRVYGGQDYLLAYWMGRYFRLVPRR